MIDCISRHAAQQIWHDAIEHRAQIGLLLCGGDCVVGGLPLQYGETVAHAVQADGDHATWQVGGMFYTELPTVVQAQKWEEQLAVLQPSQRTASFMHLHLDLDAAGLLKMAVYTIVNQTWLPQTLTMEQD